MRTFKLTTGISDIYQIEKTLFEELTNRKSPYYRCNSQGEIGQYAVCPKCDNPIQLIGLYKTHNDYEKPYGKHHTRSIPDLAVYNQKYYNDCPLASKNLCLRKDDLRDSITEFELNIYILMREQFDRAVYVLQNSIDVKFSENMIRAMLRDYLLMRGYLYRCAYVNNIPWMLGYMSAAKSLYGQYIRVDSPLYDAIKDTCKTALFEESRYSGLHKLINKPGGFLNIQFAFCTIRSMRITAR